jgi:hypothetical protein
MWIYPGLISYPHLTYWHLIYSRGRLRIWSIGLSQSICSDCRFTWSVITLLWWTRPAGDLPHEEVHLDDEIPSNAHNIIVLGIQNNESFVFWEMTKIIFKCGRQICRHLSCPSRLQMDPKQNPRHECFKLSYRVIDKCNRRWTNNRKMKVTSLKFGQLWTLLK